MWTYRQLTGALASADGGIVGYGYSGHDACKNEPCRQDVPMHGPIPRGKYTIGEHYDSESHGPLVMRLTPHLTNEMFGRSGFLLHGDSMRAPGTASEGCIVMGRSIRVAVAASSDRELEVIA